MLINRITASSSGAHKSFTHNFLLAPLFAKASASQLYPDYDNLNIKIKRASGHFFKNRLFEITISTINNILVPYKALNSELMKASSDLGEDFSKDIEVYRIVRLSNICEFPFIGPWEVRPQTDEQTSTKLTVYVKDPNFDSFPSSVNFGMSTEAEFPEGGFVPLVGELVPGVDYQPASVTKFFNPKNNDLDLYSIRSHINSICSYLSATEHQSELYFTLDHPIKQENESLIAHHSGFIF